MNVFIQIFNIKEYLNCTVYQLQSHIICQFHINNIINIIPNYFLVILQLVQILLHISLTYLYLYNRSVSFIVIALVLSHINVATQSIWSILVFFWSIQSTLVQFGPLGSIKSNLVNFGSLRFIRSTAIYLVTLDHFYLF